jgi:hypothetical protein
MTGRAVWLAIFAGLVAVFAATPTGAKEFGPRITARSTAAPAAFGFRRLAPRRSNLPVVVWPYPPYIDYPPVESAPDDNTGTPNPYVIVISGPPPGPAMPPATAPAAPSGPPPATAEYGYPSVCHPIPNGYHCDTDHNSAAP